LLVRSRATCMQATPATWRMLINTGWSGDKNLKVLCGGEALTADLARKLVERSSDVWNLYGPTETTIWSAIHQVTSVQESVPVGRAIANTEIYVLDAHLHPVPAGVPGDIYIGGDGLARGYLNRPDLTAEKFIPNPFDQMGSSGRIYKTGDVGRYRSDGTLELWGRSDDQVKVLGYRIEPNEIATILNQHAAIAASIVVAREDAAGEKRLVAYVVPKVASDLCESDLREHVRAHLPQYMVPATFVRLESLPLNSNGKVDRGALPAPRVAETLASVLHVNQIGANDNFFMKGGDSLAGIQFIARLCDCFGVNLTLRDLFESPTVAGISSLIERVLPEEAHMREGRNQENGRTVNLT
jgi:acyl-CoA synthetase (AMP-forming)/AMP-acid ligase II